MRNQSLKPPRFDQNTFARVVVSLRHCSVFIYVLTPTGCYQRLCSGPADGEAVRQEANCGRDIDHPGRSLRQQLAHGDRPEDSFYLIFVRAKLRRN